MSEFSPKQISRRNALKFIGGAAAFIASGCGSSKNPVSGTVPSEAPVIFPNAQTVLCSTKQEIKVGETLFGEVDDRVREACPNISNEELAMPFSNPNVIQPGTYTWVDKQGY